MNSVERSILENEHIEYGAVGFVIKRLKGEDYENTFQVIKPQNDVLNVVFDVLQQQGKIIDLPNEGGGITVAVLISGIAKGPSIVKVTIIPLEKGCRLIVNGYSIEGLIKMRNGEKSAIKVISLLISRCN